MGKMVISSIGRFKPYLKFIKHNVLIFFMQIILFMESLEFELGIGWFSDTITIKGEKKLIYSSYGAFKIK
jgi:hypothetical protein